MHIWFEIISIISNLIPLLLIVFKSFPWNLIQLYKFNKHNPITINNLIGCNVIFKKNVTKRVPIFRIPNKKSRSYKRKKKKISKIDSNFTENDINRVSMRHVERKYETRMKDDSASPCNFAGWRWIQWRADRQSWWLRNQDPK